ncbi:MAG: UxaA family hydrolase, partial [Rhodospirillales bacterium]
KAVKRAPAKRKAVKKAVKRAPAKRKAVKKAAKRTPAKRKAAKKSPAKRRAVKKAVKRAPAKRKAVKKAAKRTPAKRKAAKRAPAKRRAAKKAPAKRKAAKRSPAKRKAAKKSSAKRRAVKKAVKRAPAKRKTAKRAPAKRKAAKKSPAKRRAVKKAVKRAPAKRKAVKKARAKRKTVKKGAKKGGKKAAKKGRRKRATAKGASALRRKARRSVARRPSIKRTRAPKVPVHVEKATPVKLHPRHRPTRARGRPVFQGYRRENGRVGVRNHVIILPLDDLSNAACESVASNIPGIMALPHPYGRLQFGEDLDLHFRTLIGTGANPNVAACVVIGIEPVWTQRVVSGIAKTGKPVAGFAIEQNGDHKTIAAASRQAKEFLHWASELGREECGPEDLWVSVKCGESDTTSGLASNPTVGNFIDKMNRWGATTCFGETSEITGAELNCAKRGKTREIGQKFLKTWQAYMDEVIEPFKTDDLSDSQPTKGNIEGGLTTIEEKAFGNLEKIGKRTRYIDVLEPAKEPKKGPGLYFMDTSSAAAECVTLQAAAGFVVHLFPTGQGNIIGNPIEPVIKLSANPRTVRTMGEHVDLDVSGILRREMNMNQAGDALIDICIRTCNGRLTSAEALGHKEFVLTKLYRSA